MASRRDALFGFANKVRNVDMFTRAYSQFTLAARHSHIRAFVFETLRANGSQSAIYYQTGQVPSPCGARMTKAYQHVTQPHTL